MLIHESVITMVTCLRLNGISPTFDTETIGQAIIKVAKSKMDEAELARYLRN